MATFEELEAATDNPEEKLAAFRDFSRQILYMALLENDDFNLSILEGDSEGADDGLGLLRSFGGFLFDQLGSQLLSPTELTLEEWTELAEDMGAGGQQDDVDLPQLAERLYDLLKRELRWEQERLAHHRFW